MKKFVFFIVVIAILQTQVVFASEEINLAAAIGASAVKKPATEQSPSESEKMDPKTKTMIIVGGVVVAGILAAVSSGGGDSATSH